MGVFVLGGEVGGLILGGGGGLGRPGEKSLQLLDL